MFYRQFFAFFCVFLAISVLGCKNDDFFRSFQPQFQEPINIQSTENFPHSISELEPIKAKLISGRNEQLSFYLEYYQANNTLPVSFDLLNQLSWQKLPSGAQISVQKRILNGNESWETYVFFQRDENCLFGSFSSPQRNLPLELYLPLLYK